MVKTRRFRGGKKSKRYSHHKRHKHHSTHRRKVKRYSRRGTKRRRWQRTKRVKRGGVRKSVMKGGAFYVIKVKGLKQKIEINTGPPRAFSFGTTDADAIQEKLNNHPDMPKGMKLADVTMIDKGKEYSGVINSKPVTINKYKNADAAAAAADKDEEEERARVHRKKQEDEKRAQIIQGIADQRQGTTHRDPKLAMEQRSNIDTSAKLTTQGPLEVGPSGKLHKVYTSRGKYPDDLSSGGRRKSRGRKSRGRKSRRSKTRRR